MVIKSLKPSKVILIMIRGRIRKVQTTYTVVSMGSTQFFKGLRRQKRSLQVLSWFWISRSMMYVAEYRDTEEIS